MACFERDGGRCMVTGAWAEKYPGVPEDAQTTPTQAVHIVPFSLGQFSENQVPRALSTHCHRRVAESH